MLLSISTCLGLALLGSTARIQQVFGDYDGDGLRDVYVINPNGEDRLFRNRGDGGFDDVTIAARLAGLTHTRMALFDDCDGDQHVDLLIVSNQGPRLFRNVASGPFVEITPTSGLAQEHGWEQVEWLDYDGDELPDLHAFMSHGGERLYHNNGLGRFASVSFELPDATPGLPLVVVAQDDLGEPQSAPITSGTRTMAHTKAMPSPMGREYSGGPASRPLSGICAESIEDQAAIDQCLVASSMPTLGMLYPLSDLLFVDATGNVGIGTAAPTQKLEVLGNLLLSSPGTGVVFADGSRQTTAARDDGVPSGFFILGNTTAAPSGYSFANEAFESAEHWEVRAPIPVARYGAGAALARGKLYVLPGLDRDGRGINRNDEYDPTTNSWAARSPGGLPHAAVTVVDEMIYSIGGDTYGSSANQQYDPVLDRWKSKASMPTRRHSAACAVLNGKIYVIGGGADKTNPALNVNEVYDPATNSWATRAAMPTARSAATAAAFNGKIYVFGGTGSSGAGTKLEAYDPAADTWSMLGTMPVSITYGLAAAGAFKISLFAGGITPNMEFDPVANSWVTTELIPTPRIEFAGTARDGQAYLVGGKDTLGNVLANNERLSMRRAYYLHQKN